jgi:hypothetical protein
MFPPYIVVKMTDSGAAFRKLTVTMKSTVVIEKTFIVLPGELISEYFRERIAISRGYFT